MPQRRKRDRFQSSRFSVRYAKSGLLHMFKREYRSCGLMDISSGGMALDTDEDFQTGQNLHLEIVVDDNPKLCLFGEIVRIGTDEGEMSSRIHIKFDRTRHHNDLERLRAFISTNGRNLTQRFDLNTLIH
jgi:hypothetical protein